MEWGIHAESLTQFLSAVPFAEFEHPEPSLVMESLVNIFDKLKYNLLFLLEFIFTSFCPEKIFSPCRIAKVKHPGKNITFSH